MMPQGYVWKKFLILFGWQPSTPFSQLHVLTQTPPHLLGPQIVPTRCGSAVPHIGPHTEDVWTRSRTGTPALWVGHKASSPSAVRTCVSLVKVCIIIKKWYWTTEHGCGYIIIISTHRLPNPVHQSFNPLVNQPDLSQPPSLENER